MEHRDPTPEEIAVMLLKTIRDAWPNGRKPNPEITHAWAKAISSHTSKYHGRVYELAIQRLIATSPDPPSLATIIAQCKNVTADLMRDPTAKAWLEQRRQKRIEANHRTLASRRALTPHDRQPTPAPHIAQQLAHALNPNDRQEATNGQTTHQ